MGDITASFSVNPKEIEQALALADFTYPRVHEAEQYRGWSKFPAIPALYEWTVRNKRCPLAGEGIKFLLDNSDVDTDIRDVMIVGRARKLWMDFCRELHTLGLLQRCDDFGFVSYQKALDIGYNVDYTVRLLQALDDNGVNSSMRANWNNDIWTQAKAQRRKGRGCREFPGEVYLLSNKNVPQKQGPNRCWLFSTAHIQELVEEIRGDPEGEEIGVVYSQGDLFPGVASIQ